LPVTVEGIFKTTAEGIVKTTEGIAEKTSKESTRCASWSGGWISGHSWCGWCIWCFQEVAGLLDEWDLLQDVDFANLGEFGLDVGMTFNDALEDLLGVLSGLDGVGDFLEMFQFFFDLVEDSGHVDFAEETAE